MFKEVSPTQVYFIQIMKDPVDLTSCIPILYLVAMHWFNERNCVSIGSPGINALAARGPHLLVTGNMWAHADTIDNPPLEEYQKFTNGRLYATFPKYQKLRFYKPTVSEMAAFRFSAYVSTVLNDRVDILIDKRQGLHFERILINSFPAK